MKKFMADCEEESSNAARNGRHPSLRDGGAQLFRGHRQGVKAISCTRFRARLLHVVAEIEID